MVEDSPIDSTGEVWNNGESCGFASHATATLINCTIADNVSAGGREVGIDNVDSPVVTLINTISWGHWADYYRCPKGFWSPLGRAYPEWEGSPLAATYSDAGTVWYDTWEGLGLISADPMFADPEDGDYTLLPGSPCMDAGSPYILDEDGSPSDMGYTGGGGPDPDIPRIEAEGPAGAIESGGSGTVSVLNTGWADLTVLGVTCPDSFHTTLGFPRTVAPGETLSVDISYTGFSECSDTLVVTHDDAYQPALRVAVTGTSPTGISHARPLRFSLDQNVPNPFNRMTTIRFSLPEAGAVRLAIYSIHGQLVRTLVDGPVQAGRHEVVWDGTDSRGAPAASGVYIYRLARSDANADELKESMNSNEVSVRPNSNEVSVRPNSNEVSVRRMSLVR